MSRFSKFTEYSWVKKTIQIFKQGLTPRDLALSITLGILLGLLPLFFINTPLLTFIVIILRLNVPVSVFVAYAVAPIHLSLLIPFIRIGEDIFGVEHVLLSFRAIHNAFSTDFVNAVQELSFQIICGVVGWASIAIPLSIVLYFVLKKLIISINNNYPETD